MKTLLILTLWVILASGVCYLLFAPERGLLHAGPLATAGLGMIGGAICLRARQERLGESVQPVKS